MFKMLSEVIKNLRKNKKISQDKLAKSLNLPRYTISNWEQGRTEPNVEQIKLLCIYFSISADELLELTIIK